MYKRNYLFSRDIVAKIRSCIKILTNDIEASQLIRKCSTVNKELHCIHTEGSKIYEAEDHLVCIPWILISPFSTLTTAQRPRSLSHPCSPGQNMRPWCDEQGQQGSVAWLAAPVHKTHSSPAVQSRLPADNHIITFIHSLNVAQKLMTVISSGKPTN